MKLLATKRTGLIPGHWGPLFCDVAMKADSRKKKYVSLEYPRKLQTFSLCHPRDKAINKYLTSALRFC